ncbi:MAG: hypothetical protein WCR52_09575 [Bacteroidota bacterium]
MKNILLLFVFALFVTQTQAQKYNEKFVKAMEKALTGMDSLSTAEQWQERSNNFERIAQKEPGQWLPAYYVAFSQIMVFNMEKDQSKYEPIINKVDKFVMVADSLMPDNSEIWVLKNMAATLHVRQNPMVNGQKFGPLGGMALEKAKKLNPENPRAYMQEGLSLLFTPPQWGGDKVKAGIILEKALEKFKAFKPETTIHPNWGEKATEMFLEMAKK